MSSPEPFDTFSFSVPESLPVDVYLVRLANGLLVARTLDELEILPPVPAPAATP